MAKVDKKELYPLFHALSLHQSGKKPISGIAISGDLAEAIQQFDRKHGAELARPESALTVDRVQAIVKLAKHDKDVSLLLLEDGPDAPRPLTQQELQAQDAAKEEMEKLVRRFWIAATYGIIALMGAIVTGWVAQRMNYDQLSGQGVVQQNITGTNQTKPINPVYIASLILVGIAAWGIADAVILAKNHWLDFERAKAAVPVIGKSWAARSRRKKKLRAEREGRSAPQ